MSFVFFFDSGFTNDTFRQGKYLCVVSDDRYSLMDDWLEINNFSKLWFSFFCILLQHIHHFKHAPGYLFLMIYSSNKISLFMSLHLCISACWMLWRYDVAKFSNKSKFIHDKFNKKLNPVDFSCHLFQNPLSFCTWSGTGTASQPSAGLLYLWHQKKGRGGHFSMFPLKYCRYK